MIQFAVALICMLLALLALALQKTYFYLPYKELKRQARYDDPMAKTLFKAAAYGADLKLLLWFITGLLAAVGFVLFDRLAPTLLSLLVVALMLWLGFIWLPRSRLTAVGAHIAIWCTPVVVWLLRTLHPLLKWAVKYIDRYIVPAHTGIYEREDLYALLERQIHQGDNRINDQELEAMRNVLQFGEYTVRDAMIPRRHVKAINVDENIGPIIIDELHASGHARFPVYEDKPTNIVGTLALESVADIKHHGKVRDHYDTHIVYAHESDGLAQVVLTFYKSKQRMLIVINSFDEYVGIVTIDDVLKHLVTMAEEEVDDKSDDRKAVAARHKHETEETVSENPPEVVE